MAYRQKGDMHVTEEMKYVRDRVNLHYVDENAYGGNI